MELDDTEYKKRYYTILHKLQRMKENLVCERCPVFKQCCAACNKIDELIQKEKKHGRSSRDTKEL
jgi:hypothetical protein